MKCYKEKTLDVETMDECKILYCTKSLPMTETCMCWGWECGTGWFNVLNEASCQLEALNILYYPKWKVRIQMDQVKSKFGTLHAYFSVVCDNYNIFGWTSKLLFALSRKMKRKSKLKSVVDKEAYTTNETEELTAEEYDKWKNVFKSSSCSLREENGKYYRDYQLYHPARVHYEPCDHMLSYKAGNLIHKAACLLGSIGYKAVTDEQMVLMNMMNTEAEGIIKDAEDECYSTCEDCGIQIGTDFSPRCKMDGWISYLCEKCASKHASFYYKNGAKWYGDKMLMTKEEVDAERNKINERTEAKNEGDEQK